MYFTLSLKGKGSNTPTNRIISQFLQTIAMQTQSKERKVYESNRNRSQDRRSWPGGHTKRNSPHHAYPGGRPVTDDIGIVGKVLFWYVGLGQTERLVIVHSDGIKRPNDGYLRGVKVVTDNVVHGRGQVQGPFSQAKSFAKDI